MQVTDTSLRLLGRHSGLADLRLEECPALTDAGLIHLSGQKMRSSGRIAILQPSAKSSMYLKYGHFRRPAVFCDICF